VAEHTIRRRRAQAHQTKAPARSRRGMRQAERSIWLCATTTEFPAVSTQSATSWSLFDASTPPLRWWRHRSFHRAEAIALECAQFHKTPRVDGSGLTSRDRAVSSVEQGLRTVSGGASHRSRTTARRRDHAPVRSRRAESGSWKSDEQILAPSTGPRFWDGTSIHLFPKSATPLLEVVASNAPEAGCASAGAALRSWQACRPQGTDRSIEPPVTAQSLGEGCVQIPGVAGT